MRRVIWSTEALEEVRAIVAYIATDNPGAAERYKARLIGMTLELAEFSERGRPSRGWVRELTLIRPYIVQYAVVDDEVRILSVRHSARRSER